MRLFEGGYLAARRGRTHFKTIGRPSISGCSFRLGFLILNSFLLALSANVWAQSKVPLGTDDANSFITLDAKEYRSNLDTHVTDLRGDVKIHFENKSLFAERVFVKTDEGTVQAEGHVVFNQGRLTIRGRKVDLNIKTGMGTFYDAVLNVEDGLHVEAKELSRIDLDRYRASQGKITTCQDCPQAWSVTGSSMDVEIEQYAEVHNALFQVRDTPVAYFPVFVFPIKTKRQSGFLLPQYAYSSAVGSEIHVPYYWAISDNSDTTFQYSYLTKGGNRMWNEFRLLQSERSFARSEMSLLRNDLVPNVPNTRYGLSVDQRLQLSPHWTERFRGELASDRLYTAHFKNDFRNTGLPTLVNEPSLSWQDPNQYAYSLVRFHRNNLPRETKGESTTSLGSINNLPEVGYSLMSFNWGGPFRSSLDLNHTGFKRKSANLDPNTGWVRTGDRTTAIFKISAPMNFMERFDWDPRVELRVDNYVFDAKGVDSTAQRAKVFVDQRLSTNFWRVYKTDYPELKAIRHSVSPLVRWSFSPPEARTLHPFFDQGDNPRFDIFDPNPQTPQSSLGTFSEEQRLHPHNILTLGTSTRIVGRYGETSRSYEEFLGANVERDFDLKQGEFGRLRVSAFGALAGLRISTEIAIDTKHGDSDMRNDLSFTSRKFSANIFQKITRTEETYGAGSTLAFLGPFKLIWSEQYNSRIARVTEENYLVAYNSPSRCWFFSMGMTRKNDAKKFDYSPVVRLTVSEGAKGSIL